MEETAYTSRQNPILLGSFDAPEDARPSTWLESLLAGKESPACAHSDEALVQLDISTMQMRSNPNAIEDKDMPGEQILYLNEFGDFIESKSHT